MKLLIIEDEPDLNHSMARFLSAAGYVCETAFNFSTALKKVDQAEYDCIVLDIMLPDGSGLDLLKRLRSGNKSDGVIILSAKDSLNDKIEGIELGADDYLTKPFHLSELSVRVSAIIRRKMFNGQSNIFINGITIDTQGKVVTVNKQVLTLTQKEYQVLLFLIINKNRVVSKNAIAEHIWEDAASGNYDFIYTHIKNIRKKILEAGGFDAIQSMYGMGYKFAELI